MCVYVCKHVWLYVCEFKSHRLYLFVHDLRGKTSQWRIVREMKNVNYALSCIYSISPHGSRLFYFTTRIGLTISPQGSEGIFPERKWSLSSVTCQRCLSGYLPVLFSFTNIIEPSHQLCRCFADGGSFFFYNGNCRLKKNVYVPRLKFRAINKSISPASRQ